MAVVTTVKVKSGARQRGKDKRLKSVFFFFGLEMRIVKFKMLAPNTTSTLPLVQAYSPGTNFFSDSSARPGKGGDGCRGNRAPKEPAKLRCIGSFQLAISV